MENTKCKLCEELILKGSITTLTETETQKLERHLQQCNSCADFQNSITMIIESAKSEPEVNLKPDSEIYAELRNRLANKQRKDQPNSLWLIQRIQSMLQYRIPAYQVAIAAVTLLFIFNLNIFKPGGEPKDNVNPIHKTGTTRNSFSSPYFVNTMPSLDSGNVGINANEDTLFAKFIFTSM